MIDTQANHDQSGKSALCVGLGSSIYNTSSVHTTRFLVFGVCLCDCISVVCVESVCVHALGLYVSIMQIFLFFLCECLCVCACL